MVDSLTNLSGSYALVTGACGFLGRALAGQLVKLGVHVTGLDVAPEVGCAPEGVTYRQVDLLDMESLQDSVSEIATQSHHTAVVFHLAAMAHVGSCNQDPVRAYALNVTATLNALETCRRAGLRRVVFPSTVLVYGTPQHLPLEEADLPLPASIYGATKLAAEAILQGYVASHGFSCTAARLGNVYGQTVPVDSVVSILVQQAHNRYPLSVRTLKPVRDFIYRDDVVEGLIRLAAALTEPAWRLVNLSSGVPSSIRDVALAICRAASLPPQIEETSSDSAEGNSGLLLSIKRLQQYTGWRPSRSLEDGLSQTLKEMALQTR